MQGLTLLQGLTLAACRCPTLPAAIRFVLNDVSNMRGEERQQLLHVSTCLAKGKGRRVVGFQDMAVCREA